MSRTDRQGFEAALEQDLGPVRLHYGPVAATLAEDRGAAAFTYGTHIVLGRAVQRATGDTLRAIIAHELIHVVQQSANMTPAAPRRWDHAPARAPPFATVRPLQRAPLQPQHFDLVPDVIANAASNLYEGAVDLGAGAIEGAVSLAGHATDFAMDVGGVLLEGAEQVVDYFAPGLLDFLCGDVLDDLAGFFCSGIDTLVGTLLNPLAEIDIMSGLEAAFGDIAAGVQSATQSLGETATAALGHLIARIVKVISLFGDDIVSVVQALSNGVSTVFTTLWESIAVPVVDFLGTVGGAVLEGFTGLVTWVWELTAPLRRAAEWAWNWVKKQFGLAWDSASGARVWLEKKAAVAWAAFLDLIEPIRTPVMVVGGILVMLSPLGPVILLTQVLPPIWEKLTWLAENWRDVEIVVTARRFLQEDVLPFLLSSVDTVRTGLATAAAWLAGMVGTAARGMANVLTAFGSSACLKSVGRALSHVADQFDRLQALAEGGFAGLEGALDAAFAALSAIFRPILDFLVRLAMVVANPPLLPVAIAAAIWLLIPDEFKLTLINFVLDLLIAFLSGVAAFLPGLGPLAVVIASAIVGFLRHLRRGEGVGDKTRINASNRIANLAAGGGPQFIAGYALGLLHGLIEGIIDPFKLLFMLFELVVTGLRVLGRVLAPYVDAYSSLAVGAHGTARAPPTSATEAPAPDTAIMSQQMTRGPPAASDSPTAKKAAPGAELPAGAADPAPAMQIAADPVALGADQAHTDAAADVAFDATGQASDADIVAALSPQTIASMSGAAPAEAVTAEELEASMRTEVADRGRSVRGLAALLGDAWSAIMEGAAWLGGRIAGALLGFLQYSDFQIGNKTGWLSGMILLELLIAYFTAGGYTVLKQGASLGRRLLSYLLRFLDIGGEILGVLGRAVAPLKGPILQGIGAVRGFLGRFSFLRGLLDRITGFARRLFGFGDEAAAAASRGPTGRAPPPPQAPAMRTPDPAPPTRAVDAPAGRRAATESADQAGARAARDVLDTPPSRPANQAAEDLGNGSMRAVDEPGVPRVRDNAAKTAQFAEARVAAGIIAETNDAVDTPIPLLLGQLIALKRRYRWIDTFRADLQRIGVYTISMIASPVVIDGRYTTDGFAPNVTPAQRARLEELRQRHGLQVTDTQLRRLAQENGSTERAIQELEHFSRTVNMPPHPDRALIDTYLPETTRHRAGVADRAGRRARRTLRKNLGPPPSAAPGAWPAHHIVPWELRSHPAVYRYERLVHGVDNPLADVSGRWMNARTNGIYLPASDLMEEAAELTMHSGAHARYTSMVESRLDQLWQRYRHEEMSITEFAAQFQSLVGDFENRLRRRAFGKKTSGGGILLR